MACCPCRLVHSFRIATVPALVGVPQMSDMETHINHEIGDRTIKISPLDGIVQLSHSHGTISREGYSQTFANWLGLQYCDHRLNFLLQTSNHYPRFR